MSHFWAALAAYASLAALITITPGVDNFLVLRFATVGGWRPALSAGLGISLGCLAWAAASLLGLTALLATSDFAFNLVRVAGAAYLCWLGIKALWRTRRRVATESGADVGAEPVRDERVSSRSAFRSGLITNLLNPKAGAFYLSILPQFLPEGYPTLPTAALFLTVHLCIGLLWFVLITFVVEQARAFLNKPNVGRRLEQVAGVAFIGLGLRIAIEGL